MDIFNGNKRLENNVMYSLEWAKYLRHNLKEPLFPFLFEWKEEELYMNMLQPGEDIEGFAYKIAEESDKSSDQFVFGIEGVLSDGEGNKFDAFIIKGFDKTQEKGVFIAQLFEGKEKNGFFYLIDKPMFISSPNLPFEIDNSLEKKYKATEIYNSGIVTSGGNLISILSHDNPAVLSNGIKNYLRGKLSEEKSKEMSGKIEFSIAPNDGNQDFLKFCLIETIKSEKESDLIKKWERENRKKLVINLKYGHEFWIREYSENIKVKNEKDIKNQITLEKRQKNNLENEENQYENLIIKYSTLLKESLDKEFHRINSNSNKQSLNEMKALTAVYEKRKIEMPSKNIPEKNKIGCLSFIILCIVIGFTISIL